MTATDTWTPGDPASWPVPRVGRVIEDDPLEGFISGVRAMRAKASDAAQACEEGTR